MKKFCSKEIVRARLQRQVDEFLNQGGKVAHIPRGISGWDNRKGMLKPTREVFNQQKKNRTDLAHLLTAIDERRTKKRPKAVKKSRLPQPRKVAVYDDFGEPIRYIWVDK